MTRLLTFLVRRVVAGVFTVVVMITIAFWLFWAIPTQPASFVYPNAPHLTNYQIHRADHFLGVDRPKLDQYFDYVGHLLRFDFGRQWESGLEYRVTGQQKLLPGFPIAPQLYPELRTTLSLILGGAFFVLLFAIPLGTFAGSRIGSLADRTISLVALVGVCTQPMVLGLILRSTFGHHLHWAPETGYCPLIRPPVPKLPPGTVFLGGGPIPRPCGGIVDWASHLALPWLTFALLFLALYVRMIRASVGETLHEDFVRTARAKGASQFRVLRRHVLPNASLRILTMIGMEIGTAIGVCIYIEVAYSLNGLASAAVQALSGNVFQLDLPLVLAVVMMITLIVVVGNLVVDMLYVVVDPRAGRGAVRHRTKSAAGGVI